MRLLWVSNYSSQSGYANQARMWVKRIQAAGHHTTVFELANGARLPVMVDNVQVLPTALDPLGSDILVQHAQTMRSHAVITLIDAWGMNKDVMQQVAWYPMCVTGDTLITLSDGRQLPIREVVEKKLDVPILAMREDRVVETRITHYHKFQTHDTPDLLTVETDQGKSLNITADNLVFSGEGFYKPAHCLKPQDVVHCIHSRYQEENNGKQGQGLHGSLSTSAYEPGMGIYRWDYRWRRQHFNQARYQETRRIKLVYLATLGISGQYKRAIDELVAQQTGYAYQPKNEKSSAERQADKRTNNSMLRNLHMGIQDVQCSGQYSSLSNNQARSMRGIDGIHRRAHDTNRQPIQRTIHARGRASLVENQGIEPETVVSALPACDRIQAETFVYDLTTETGNFFANGILIHNCPVDTQPVAPHVAEALKSCQRPIAYAKYGWTELKKAGFDPLYWPHAVDPAVWFPRDKMDARKRCGLEDGRFVASFVGVNDSNPSRKGIPELLMAWQIFSSMHADVLLYLHTALHGNLPVAQHGGVRIDVMLKTFGINPNTVRVVDQYRYRTGIPAGELADLAAASDVFVLPTRGEGFGLPLLEFQRVGTPVITTNAASGAELCFGGWLIGGEPSWSWQDCIVTKPGIADLVDALEAAYEERNDPERRRLAIEGAKEYDVDYVFSKYGVPTLNAIADHVLDSLQVA